jgi:hypothetical protein
MTHRAIDHLRLAFDARLAAAVAWRAQEEATHDDWRGMRKRAWRAEAGLDRTAVAPDDSEPSSPPRAANSTSQPATARRLTR